MPRRAHTVAFGSTCAHPGAHLVQYRQRMHGDASTAHCRHVSVHATCASLAAPFVRVQEFTEIGELLRTWYRGRSTDQIVRLTIGLKRGEQRRQRQRQQWVQPLPLVKPPPWRRCLPCARHVAPPPALHHHHHRQSLSCIIVGHNCPPTAVAGTVLPSRGRVSTGRGARGPPLTPTFLRHAAAAAPPRPAPQTRGPAQPRTPLCSAPAALPTTTPGTPASPTTT